MQRWDEQRWERVSCQTYLYMSWWSCPVHILGNSHRCIPRPPEYTGRSHSRAGCRSHLRRSNRRRTHSALRDQTRIRTKQNFICMTQIHVFFYEDLCSTSRLYGNVVVCIRLLKWKYNPNNTRAVSSKLIRLIKCLDTNSILEHLRNFAALHKYYWCFCTGFYLNYNNFNNKIIEL